MNTNLNKFPEIKVILEEMKKKISDLKSENPCIDKISVRYIGGVPEKSMQVIDVEQVDGSINQNIIMTQARVGIEVYIDASLFNDILKLSNDLRSLRDYFGYGDLANSPLLLSFDIIEQ